jgi:hypothetical protein
LQHFKKKLSSYKLSTSILASKDSPTLDRSIKIKMHLLFSLLISATFVAIGTSGLYYPTTTTTKSTTTTTKASTTTTAAKANASANPAANQLPEWASANPVGCFIVSY